MKPGNISKTGRENDKYFQRFSGRLGLTRSENCIVSKGVQRRIPNTPLVAADESEDREGGTFPKLTWVDVYNKCSTNDLLRTSKAFSKCTINAKYFRNEAFT